MPAGWMEAIGGTRSVYAGCRMDHGLFLGKALSLAAPRMK
jgi:hypothetical protein